jgi:hypothetical protein
MLFGRWRPLHPAPSKTTFFHRSPCRITRAPDIDDVPSLAEEALRRLEQEDDEHDDGLPPSLPSECSDLDDDPQGLADALARLIASFAPQVARTTRDAACAI